MTIKKLAQRLYFLKALLNFVFIAGILFIVILFLNMSIEQQNNYALPSLLVATWSLLLSALLGLLVRMPSNAKMTKSWFSRIKKRLAKSLFFVTATMFVFVSLALLYATIKLLNL